MSSRQDAARGWSVADDDPAVDLAVLHPIEDGVVLTELSGGHGGVDLAAGPLNTIVPPRSGAPVRCQPPTARRCLWEASRRFVYSCSTAGAVGSAAAALRSVILPDSRHSVA